jgi:hypothetical protein
MEKRLNERLDKIKTKAIQKLEALQRKVFNIESFDQQERHCGLDNTQNELAILNRNIAIFEKRLMEALALNCSAVPVPSTHEQVQ